MMIDQMFEGSVAQKFIGTWNAIEPPMTSKVYETIRTILITVILFENTRKDNFYKT